MNFPTTVSVQNRAIVCRNHRLEIEETTLLQAGSHDVVIDVMAVGICRTDLYAISGKIPTKSDPLIPGHEFAGVVAAVGADITQFQEGDRVVINPVVACGTCSDCKNNQLHLCANVSFMGIDLDGACCEQVKVPGNMVHKVPDEMPFDIAAFAEPVAATLGIFNSGIKPHEKGLLIGDSRISKLAERVLHAKGFTRITLAKLEQVRHLPDNKYDFIIETNTTTDVFNEMIRLVRSRGRLILKSRQYEPFEIILRDIVAKQPIIEVVHYGPFSEAVKLLVTEQIIIDDLIGKRFLFDEFAEAFATAENDEDKKVFLIPRSH